MAKKKTNQERLAYLESRESHRQTLIVLVTTILCIFVFYVTEPLYEDQIIIESINHTDIITMNATSGKPLTLPYEINYIECDKLHERINEFNFPALSFISVHDGITKIQFSAFDYCPSNHAFTECANKLTNTCYIEYEEKKVFVKKNKELIRIK